MQSLIICIGIRGWKNMNAAFSLFHAWFR